MDILNQLLAGSPVGLVAETVVRDTFSCIKQPMFDLQGSSFSSTVRDTIQLQQGISRTPNVSVDLPPSLLGGLNLSSLPAVIFCVFRDHRLFIRRRSYLNNSSDLVASFPMTVSVLAGVPFDNLEEPVIMTFGKNQVCVL